MFLPLWPSRFDCHSVYARRAMISFDLFVRGVQFVPVLYAFHQIASIVSFSVIRRTDTRRSRISFPFHAIYLRAAHSIFCAPRPGFFQILPHNGHPFLKLYAWHY